MSDELVTATANSCCLTDADDDGKINLRELDQFDYFRLTLADFNGIASCVSVPRRHIQECLDDGAAHCVCILSMTAASNMVIHEDAEEPTLARCGNGLLIPKASTLRSLPWATGGKHRVGEFLCEMSWMPTSYRSGGPQTACPRYVARRQLRRLGDLGFRLYSAYEAEFTVLQRSDLKPIFGGPVQAMMTSLEMSQHETFVYDVESLMARGGIDISRITPEFGSGQLEFAPQPKYGIEAADTMFRLREAVKEISLQREWIATFMAKPFPEMPPSGLHFNHSLWSTNKNAMYDPNQPDKLADITKHWVAGLLKHVGALTALCCPTVNCYRRLGGSSTPKCADWAMDDRRALLRVKNYNPKETYVENRLPSAPANPYLVMAATVAAGLDGIESRLQCPPERVDGTQGVPLVKNLTDALQALEHDDVIKDALGEEFVSWFIKNKREGEVVKLKHSSFEDERKVYFDNL